MSEPYHTDQWFTSPWNWEPEVVKDFCFPEKIKLHDVTLRDGEQQAGIILRQEEKVRIAEALARAGVHRIEAGMPAVSKQDEGAIKQIVKEKFGPEIFAFARCMKPDVERAAQCGVDGIVIEIPSSEHIIQKAYKWELQRAVDLSVEATRYAKECGLYTVFFPIDFTRASMTWVLDLIEKVATEGHMDALAVVDTFGGLAPSAVPHVIRTIKSRIDKPLETHFHDDFRLGTANTALALAAGAEVAHVTVSGIGERAGNVPLEDLVMTLLTMYGQDIGVDTKQFFELSALVCELTGAVIPSNRAVVGPTTFDVESGIIADWVRNCGEENALELTPYRPQLVGQQPARIVLGKNSGLPSVVEYLERTGLSCSDKDKLLGMVAKIKEKAFDQKQLLTVEQFQEIASEFLS
ncbi:MAG: pyruvate carboxyltransferase [Planctomycetota bacterium]|nr:pyruvate carboxyltransferase [Planctomycetota bacterium]